MRLSFAKTVKLYFFDVFYRYPGVYSVGNFACLFVGFLSEKNTFFAALIDFRAAVGRLQNDVIIVGFYPRRNFYSVRKISFRRL